ncbi:unnamed protein product [Periconia digitata]|uniref:Uncharacterized protein n=1 Tax=Periconia digitata TaxID=1303443 RepID=A0A9W4UQK0_9PLEO|nr:unnamed protein product [Periconia digitata]
MYHRRLGQVHSYPSTPIKCTNTLTHSHAHTIQPPITCVWSESPSDVVLSTCRKT